jgi:hypothetical protein
MIVMMSLHERSSNGPAVAGLGDPVRKGPPPSRRWTRPWSAAPRGAPTPRGVRVAARQRPPILAGSLHLPGRHRTTRRGAARPAYPIASTSPAAWRCQRSATRPAGSGGTTGTGSRAPPASGSYRSPARRRRHSAPSPSPAWRSPSRQEGDREGSGSGRVWHLPPTAAVLLTSRPFCLRSPSYAVATDDAAFDDRIRQSMAEAFAVAGGVVGTPAMVLGQDRRLASSARLLPHHRPRLRRCGCGMRWWPRRPCLVCWRCRVPPAASGDSRGCACHSRTLRRAGQQQRRPDAEQGTGSSALGGSWRALDSPAQENTFG